jgi:hypothetical protein
MGGDDESGTDDDPRPRDDDACTSWLNEEPCGGVPDSTIDHAGMRGEPVGDAGPAWRVPAPIGWKPPESTPGFVSMAREGR